MDSPKGAGHRGDADVHLLAGDAGGDAAVLGQAALCDVDAADELDARGHRGETLNGLGEPAVQDAVHPHAHGEVLFGGLHVDIRSIEVHRLGEQVVHQLDHRGFLGHLAQLLRIAAGEQVLDGAFLAHEIHQAVDLVVGGQVEGHGLAG